MPEVSIIVPVYKAEQFLQRCVESILNQSYTNFELLLVDDGSPDKSPEICDYYARTDSRVRVFHQRNQGVSAARNKGIDEADGKFIMFCDSDDYVHPEWIRVMVNQAQKHPTAVIVCNVLKGKEGKAFVSPAVDEKFSVFQYLDLFKNGISPYCVNKIYNRSVLKDHNIRFDSNIGFSEDVMFNCVYMKFCDVVLYTETELYYYFDNSESAMNLARFNLFELHLLPFKERLPFIAEQELQEYCDIWLFQFLNLLENVWKKEFRVSILKRMMYNQKMVETEAFQYCLEHASGKNENPVMLKFLKMRNYYLYWMFEQISKFKNKIGGSKS